MTGPKARQSLITMHPMRRSYILPARQSPKERDSCVGEKNATKYEPCPYGHPLIEHTPGYYSGNHETEKSAAHIAQKMRAGAQFMSKNPDDAAAIITHTKTTGECA